MSQIRSHQTLNLVSLVDVWPVWLHVTYVVDTVLGCCSVVPRVLAFLCCPNVFSVVRHGPHFMVTQVFGNKFGHSFVCFNFSLRILGDRCTQLWVTIIVEPTTCRAIVDRRLLLLLACVEVWEWPGSYTSSYIWCNVSSTCLFRFPIFIIALEISTIT